MIPMIEVSGEAQSSAALSLTAALIQKLILKNILTKDEAIDLYDALAKAKESKAELHANPVEEEAAALLAHLAARLKENL
jgi:hypothetical protein